MRNAALLLERFDAPSAVRRLEAPAENGAGEDETRRAAYAEGFAAGEAAARAAASETAPLLAAAASALQSACQDAPRRITDEAAGALAVILERLFPELSKAGFAAEAAAAFARIARETDAPSLEIFTSPEQVEALRAALARQATDADITVTADPGLAGATAQARWSGGGVDFDLDRTTKECLAALEKAAQSIGSERDL